MSANDILDVLNIKRDESAQPAKKKQKVEHNLPQKGAMARELYNLLGPNTPPVSVGVGANKVRDRKQKVSPWTRTLFKPNKKNEHAPELHHWQKGSEELLKQENAGKPYFFDKFAVSLDIPEFVDEPTFDRFMAEILEREKELREERKEQDSQENEKEKLASLAENEKPKITASELVAKIKGSSSIPSKENDKTNGTSARIVKANDKKVKIEPLQAESKKIGKTTTTSAKSKEGASVKNEDDEEDDNEENDEEEEDEDEGEEDDDEEDDDEDDDEEDDEEEEGENDDSAVEQKVKDNDDGEEDEEEDDDEEDDEEDEEEDEEEDDNDDEEDEDGEGNEGGPNDSKSKKDNKDQNKTDTNESEPDAKEATSAPEDTSKSCINEEDSNAWTYAETKLLFEYCKEFELKWFVISDRFPYDRTMEELKEQFYRVSSKILKYQGNANPTLIESLDAFSKVAEIDRKQYLESLLKRTPAEIAEEESLVIEARRFELAAKKMLMERSHLLTLLDSPQTSQSVQQYLSSQGLTNLYNKLMILDKQQKKKMHQRTSSANSDPVPPSIPVAASSSLYKKDRNFQTHLLQYLAGLVKQQGQVKGEPSPIQQLLSKRLTTKEEEAYGLHYHANERLTPGVILRSTQRLPGLQQRQSVFKSVNTMLQELDIPTAGNTTWKPVMPTRKTMTKYDELIRAVVALLDVKKGKDKLEAEIELIKSQRGLQ